MINLKNLHSTECTSVRIHSTMQSREILRTLSTHKYVAVRDRRVRSRARLYLQEAIHGERDVGPV